MELSDWFKGFEKGIARLSSEQREALCHSILRGSRDCKMQIETARSEGMGAIRNR